MRLPGVVAGHQLARGLRSAGGSRRSVSAASTSRSCKIGAVSRSLRLTQLFPIFEKLLAVAARHALDQALQRVRSADGLASNDRLIRRAEVTAIDTSSDELINAVAINFK